MAEGAGAEGESSSTQHFALSSCSEISVADSEIAGTSRDWITLTAEEVLGRGPAKSRKLDTDSMEI